MTAWTKRFSVFGLAGMLYVVGQYLWGRWFESFPINLCQYVTDTQGTYCHSPYINTGFALIAAGQVFAIVGVILLFANRAAWRRWLVSSLVYVPITAYISFSVGGLSPLGLPTYNSVGYPDRWIWLFGALYILITFIIVLVSRLRAPRPPQTPA